MRSGRHRPRPALGALVALALVLGGAACGGGGDGEEKATSTGVQLIDPDDTRAPQPTASTTSTTTTTEPPTTTTTEAPTTTTTTEAEEPEGEVPGDVVDRANYICGAHQYANQAGGDQPDAVGTLRPVTEAVVAELRPLAEANGGRFLEAVQNLDLAIAFSAQADGRDRAVAAYDAAADGFRAVGIHQCAVRPG